MLNSPTLLITAVFGLGMRHGLDLDHLATIDAISRTLPAASRLSKKVGLLFSLGHGVVVLLLSLILTSGLIQTHFPTWLESLGNWISITFLLIFGVLTLKNIFNRSEKSSAGLKVQLLTLNQNKSYSAGLIIMIGALFALSFDTFTQVALFSISSIRGIGFAGLLSLCFMFGMMATDGLNGLIIGSLIQKVDQKGLWISRGLGMLIAVFSLGLGVHMLFNQNHFFVGPGPNLQKFLTYQPVTSANASPKSAGDRTVRTPAASNAANFSAAVPFPPEIIAPACPIRLPSGAVTPAI